MAISAKYGDRVVVAQDMSDEDWKLCHSPTPQLVLETRCCQAPAIAKVSVKGNRFFAHRAMSRITCPWKPVSNRHDALLGAVYDYLVGKGFEPDMEEQLEGHTSLDFMLELPDDQGRIAIMVETSPLQQRTMEGIERDRGVLERQGFKEIIWLVPASWKKAELPQNWLYYRAEENVDAETMAVRMIARHFMAHYAPKPTSSRTTGVDLMEGRRASAGEQSAAMNRTSYLPAGLPVSQLAQWAARTSLGGTQKRIEIVTDVAHTYFKSRADEWLQTPMAGIEDNKSLTPMECATAAASVLHRLLGVISRNAAHHQG